MRPPASAVPLSIFGRQSAQQVRLGGLDVDLTIQFEEPLVLIAVVDYWSLVELNPEQAGTVRMETIPEQTGEFAIEETVVDPNDVMLVIDDAREEEIQRQLRLAS